jgi:hypothetical protein
MKHFRSKDVSLMLLDLGNFSARVETVKFEIPETRRILHAFLILKKEYLNYLKPKVY